MAAAWQEASRERFGVRFQLRASGTVGAFDFFALMSVRTRTSSPLPHRSPTAHNHAATRKHIVTRPPRRFFWQVLVSFVVTLHMANIVCVLVALSTSLSCARRAIVDFLAAATEAATP